MLPANGRNIVGHELPKLLRLFARNFRKWKQRSFITAGGTLLGTFYQGVGNTFLGNIFEA